jgi:hypothetical protein
LHFSGYGTNSEISQEQILKQTFGGLTIRRETIVRHENFIQQLRLHQKREVSIEEFRDTFGDTYQYYFLTQSR